MTFVPSELMVPIDASQAGLYEIFAKSFFGPQSSKIAFFVDGTPVGTIQTRTAVDTGFRWTQIGQDTISPGKHELKVQSSEGENALDSLVVVPKSQLDLANQTAQSLIDGMSVLAFSKLDSQTTAQSYELVGNALLDALGSSSRFRYPSSGQYAIRGSNQNTSITLTLTQPANSTDELWCQIPLSLDISQFQQIDVTFKLSNPLQTFFEPILDLNLNGTEAWLRFGDFSSLTSTLRSDGIYDITVPVTPTDSLVYNPSDQLLHLKLDVANVIRQVFHRLTQGTINQLRLGFGKNINVDFSNQGSATLDLGQIIFSGSKWFPMMMGSQASEGFAMSTIGQNVLNYPVYVPKTGPYSLFIRASNDAGGNLTATLTNSTTRVQLSTNRNFTSYSLGEFNLPMGYSNLQLTSPQNATSYLDELILKQDADQSPQGPARLSYTQVDPAHYLIDVTAKTPASIFFSEAYNPSWMLKLTDGTTIPSVPGYGFGNLFIIGKPGTYSGTIEWGVSNLYDFAKYLSLGVLATLVVLMSLPRGTVGKRIRILRLCSAHPTRGKLAILSPPKVRNVLHQVIESG